MNCHFDPFGQAQGKLREKSFSGPSHPLGMTVQDRHLAPLRLGGSNIREPKIAADTYKILRQIVNSDGDIEEPVLKSIIDKIRQESGIAAEIPTDRLVDLSILRAVKAELKKK